jgi:hypothetical protein
MYLIQSSRTSPPARVITGRSLAHRRLGAGRRAAVAAQLLEGEVVIALSARQAALLLGANAAYVHAARKLSAAKRQAIADGTDPISFVTLLKAPSMPLELSKPVSDAALISVIRDAGLDRTLAAACAVENAA